MAIQIADDLKQIVDALEECGSPSDDMMNKRKLYPVVWSFEVATPQQRRQLGDFYFKRVLEPSDARSLARLVDCIGGTAQARSLIASRLDQVRESLAIALPNCESSEGLEILIRDVVGVG